MKILRYILLVFMCLNLSGCVTYMTVQKARGEPEKNKEGKSEATEDPKPGYYFLVPLTVPLDAALLPFYGLFYIVAGMTGYKG